MSINIPCKTTTDSRPLLLSLTTLEWIVIREEGLVTGVRGVRTVCEAGTRHFLEDLESLALLHGDSERFRVLTEGCYIQHHLCADLLLLSVVLFGGPAEQRECGSLALLESTERLLSLGDCRQEMYVSARRVISKFPLSHS